MKTFTALPARLRDDGQPRAADFLDVAPKLLRGDPLHARGILGDDDLRPRLAVFDEEECPQPCEWAGNDGEECRMRRRL